MLYIPCQQFLSYVGMISCLPGSNQYQAADKGSCSSTHLHSESVGGESPISSPSIPQGQLSKNNLRKIAIIFLSISLNMCFGCSKEPFHRDGSFMYPQHMFWLRNKKNNFQLRSLIWGPAIPSLMLCHLSH